MSNKEQLHIYIESITHFKYPWLIINTLSGFSAIFCIKKGIDKRKELKDDKLNYSFSRISIFILNTIIINMITVFLYTIFHSKFIFEIYYNCEPKEYT